MKIHKIESLTTIQNITKKDSKMNFDDYEISPDRIQKLKEGLRSENWKNYYSVITIGTLSDITEEVNNTPKGTPFFFTNHNPHAELDLPIYDS